MTMDFSTFPREMQIQILRIALLVFWEWRNIGEDPWLWKEVTVTLDCGDVELTRTVLGFRRFLFMKKLICGPKTKYCKCAEQLQEQEEQFMELFPVL